MFDPLGGLIALALGFAGDAERKLDAKINPYQSKQKKDYLDYPDAEVPHRAPDGSIIIENSQLYYEDVKNYGAYQASKWMEQGKYNLSPAELEKEEERIKAKYKRLYSYR